MPFALNSSIKIRGKLRSKKYIEFIDKYQKNLDLAITLKSGRYSDMYAKMHKSIVNFEATLTI